MSKSAFERATQIGGASGRMTIGEDRVLPSLRVPDLRRQILLSVVSAVAALLLVTAPASADTQTFTNPALIKIPASSDGFGPASPYPSSVAVSRMSGPVTDINVTLHRVGHADPAEIRVLLVSPSGDTVILMRSNCGLDNIEDFTWIFDQQAATPMPRDGTSCPGFVYRPNPSNVGGTPPAPAPPGPHGVSLNDFNNENPNGTWSLYVYDSDGETAGDIEGGWSLTLSTGSVDVTIPATGTDGSADPYPATRTVSGHTGGITDVNVTIDGIWHKHPDDMDVLLVGPRGQQVILMSDACGSYGVRAYGWVWDDEAAAAMPDGDDTNACGTRFHRPANYGSGDVWPAPAPAGPYSTSLSAFDYTNPNGEWRLFVQDDAAGGTGFFTNRFSLAIATDTSAPTVTSVSPANNATGIGFAANVRATFSEAMRAGSINRNTFELFKAGTTTRIGAAVSYDAAARRALLNPNAKLKPNSRYKAVVTTGARDLSGNQLDQNSDVSGNQQKVWFFTTRR